MKKSIRRNPNLRYTKPQLMRLEPRIMFDGAMVDTSVEVAGTADGASTDPAMEQIEAAMEQSFGPAAIQAPQDEAKGETPDPTEHPLQQMTGSDADIDSDQTDRALEAIDSESSAGILVIIDSRVENYQSLLEDLPENAILRVVQANESGLEVIGAELANGGTFEAVHIISHGTPGSFSLGTDTVNSQTLADQAESFESWAGHLTEEADILLYGCDLAQGEAGEFFINELARLTSADIAASTNATGNADKGGDWVLESATGTIEADVLAIMGYDGLLAATGISAGVKELSVIEPSSLNAPGADRVNLSNAFWNITGTDTFTINVTLSDGTATGSLTNTGSATAIANGYSFTGTAEQIKTWLDGVQFVAADTELGQTAKTTTLTVASGSISQTVTLTVTPSNDPTTFANSGNLTATVVEASTGTELGASVFAIIDPELTAGVQQNIQIVYTLTDLPEHGYLTVNDVRVGAGSTFTHADVVGNKVKYVHTTTTGPQQNDSDSFKVKVNDGATPIAQSVEGTVNITITPVNQVPSVSGSGMIWEGQPANAAGSVVGNLIVADSGGDPGQNDSNLKVAITNLPSDGTLYWDGVALSAAGLEFAYDQRHRLTYSNNGNRDETPGTPYGYKDGFNVTVTDAGGASQSATIDLNVAPVNDDPRWVDSSTLAATVTVEGVTGTAANDAEGGYIVTLTTAMLNATDVDSDAERITFAITNKADLKHGHILLRGKILANDGTFTLEDIQKGEVQYVQTIGADASDLTDTFEFKIVDKTQSIRWQPNGDQIVRMGGVYDNKGTGDLNNDELRTFLFTINLVEGSEGNGTAFTQWPDYIEAGGSNHAGVDNLGTGYGTLIEGGDVVLKGKGGDPATQPYLEYTVTDVPPEHIVYTILGYSNEGGKLEYSSDNGATWTERGLYSTFTQDDIDEGRIRFKHDGDSEVFRTTVSLSAASGVIKVTGGMIDPLTRVTDFTFYTTPTNDLPTVSGSSSAVVAEGGTIGITTGLLALGDPDDATSEPELESSATLPSVGGNNFAFNNGDDLRFKITTLPPADVGTLEYKDDSGVWQPVVADTLLSSSLLTGDGTSTGLRFVSNADSEARDTNFQVKAVDRWDAESSSTATVTIQITNVNDAPVIAKTPIMADPAHSDTNWSTATANNPATVYEGQSFQLTTDFLSGYDSDNDKNQVQYRITTAASQGYIAFSTNGTDFTRIGQGSAFTQAQLEAGQIYYIHDGTESNGNKFTNDTTYDPAQDTFTFTLSDGNLEQTGNEFWIYVKPTNDAPIVTGPTIPVPVGDQATPVPGFKVVDPDLADGVNGDETNEITVIVRVLGEHGDPLANTGDYSGITLTPGSGASVDATFNGSGTYLKFTGTPAQVKDALDGLTVKIDNNLDKKYSLQVIADDRVANDKANGGDKNQPEAEGKPLGIISNDPINGFTTTTTELEGDTFKGNVSQASVELWPSAVNTPPTFTVPNTTTPLPVYEDIASPIGNAGFTLSDEESAAFGSTVTVTLEVAQGTLSVGNALGSISTAGSTASKLVLTGTAAEIEALLQNTTQNGVKYKSATDANHDQNGPGTDAQTNGDVTLKITLDEGESFIGLGTKTTTTEYVALNIIPVNDRPTVSQPSPTDTVIVNGTTPVSGFSIADKDVDGDIPDNGTNSDHLTSEGEGPDTMQVTIRLLPATGDEPLTDTQHGNVIFTSSYTGGSIDVIDGYNGVGKALVIQGTLADVDAYVKGLQVELSDTLLNSNETYRVQVVADDRVRDGNGALDSSGMANGGKNPAAGGAASDAIVPDTDILPYGAIPGGLTHNVHSATRYIMGTSVNEQPGFDKLGGATAGTSDVPYTENGAAVKLDPDAELTDPELGKLGAGSGNWNGAILTLQRHPDDGGANPSDVFDVDVDADVTLESNGDVKVGDQKIGTYTNANGKLEIKFSDNATNDQVNTLLQAITYKNTADDLPAETLVRIQYTIDDNNPTPGSSGEPVGDQDGQDQGSGGKLTNTGEVVVKIVPWNDAPSITDLTAKEYTEDGVAVVIGSGVKLADPELVNRDNWNGATVTVSRNDGPNPQDVFSATGTLSALTEGSALTDNGTDIGTVTKNSGGELTITFANGVTTAQAEAALAKIGYSNMRQDLGEGATDTVTLKWTVNDENMNNGTSGTAGSGQDQGHGGKLDGSMTQTITLRGVNDVPTKVGTLPDKADVDNAAITPVETAGGFADVDTVGDKLTYTADGLPPGLTIDANTGKITGTPDKRASQGGPSSDGVYTVTIKATDEQNAFVEQTFTWTITNPAPTAVLDTNSVNKNDTVTKDAADGVIKNDSDPDGDPLTVVGVKTGNDTSSPVSTGVGTAITTGYGTLTLNADGSYSYVADGPLSAVLISGENPTDTFTYTISDGDGGFATTTLTITIYGADEANPSFAINGGGLTGEQEVYEKGLRPPAQGGDGSHVVTGEVAIDTPNRFDSIEIAGTSYNLTQLQTGTVEIDTGEGTLRITGVTDVTEAVPGEPTKLTLEYSYTLKDPQTHGTAGNDKLPDMIALKVTDKAGKEVDGTLTIQIVDDVPEAKDDLKVVDNHNGKATGNVMDNDIPGADRAVAVTDILGPKGPGTPDGAGVITVEGNYGTLVIGPGGSFTYSRYDDAPINEIDLFTYTITDADGDPAQAQLKIVIQVEAPPPFIEPPAPPADPTPPYVEPPVPPQDSSPSPHLGLDTTGEMPPYEVGRDPFDDGYTPQLEYELLLEKKIPDQPLEEGKEMSFLIPKDTFRHTDPSAKLTLVAAQLDGSPLPDWLTFDSATGGFSGTPPAGFSGEMLIRVVARDGANRQVETIVRMGDKVVDPSMPPYEVGKDPAVGEAGKSGEYELLLEKKIPDQPLGEGKEIDFLVPQDTFRHTDPSAKLILSAAMVDGSPLPDWLKFDPNTGGFKGTPPAGTKGEMLIKVIAKDEAGRQVETILRISDQIEPSYAVSIDASLMVDGLHVLKVAKAVPDLLMPFEADGAASIDYVIPMDAFVHSDPNAQVDLSAMMLDGSELPDWLEFDPKTGKFKGVPPKGFKGELQIKVIARDQEGRQAETILRIKVGDPKAEKQDTQAIKGKPSLTSMLKTQGSWAWKAERDRLVKLGQEVDRIKAGLNKAG